MFRTKTAEFGRELWQSDGTEEGTRMLKNINEDPNISGGDSDPVVLAEFKNLVFFAATDAIHGRKLWVTDGTEDGTRFFKDIILSATNFTKLNHIIFEDKLFFVANDEIHGFELWVSDGTSEGTRLLMDINPGIGDGSPWGFTLADGYFFFSANNGVNGRELWRSDGTPENTYMVKDILPGPSGSIVQSSLSGNGIFEQGKYYFAASDSIHGNEVWMSDGTEAGTVLLKDIRPGTLSSTTSVNRPFFSFAGYVYFLASPDASPLRLYVTNGTTAGTNIAAQLPSNTTNLSSIISVAPGVFICTTNTFSSSWKLWLILTLGELVLIDEISMGLSPNPTALMDCGHGLYFNAVGRQIFYLPYDSFIPVRITEINPNGQGFNVFNNAVRVGNRFFFPANDYVSGRQLWAMDPPYSQLVVSDGASEVPSGDTIDFGRILVGQSIDTSIFLRNSGTASLRLLNADELNPQYFSAEINTDTIAAGDSVEVRLSYTAQALGTYLDTLAFLSLSVDDKIYTVFLKVQVVEPAAVINISENEQPVESGALLNFGTVLLGADSLRSIRIVNSGTISLDISNIQTTGIHFSAQNIPTSISPGSSENIEIRFIPTVAGEHTGSLSFNTNDTDHPSFMLNLAGTGQMASRVHTLAEMGISVFPNPVDAVLFVKFQQAPVKGTAVVLNATGQVLKKLDVSQGELSEISVKELPNGVYMLQISLEDRSGAIQFIKQ